MVHKFLKGICPRYDRSIMSQNTKKPYDLPDWPAEAEQTQEAPRPRRKRRAPAEPEDLWGKLRFRAGKKVRWFGRRCRRVVREAQAHRFPESNRKPLQFLQTDPLSCH